MEPGAPQKAASQQGSIRHHNSGHGNSLRSNIGFGRHPQRNKARDRRGNGYTHFQYGQQRDCDGRSLRGLKRCQGW
jgi:hypothetical protein